MVRHPRHEDAVYPFSFTDLESANRFVLEEMKRGLDLRSVLIYWAVFTEIESGPNDEARVVPATPPSTRPCASEPASETEPSPHTQPKHMREPQPHPDPIAAYKPPAQPTTLNELIGDLARVLNVTSTETRSAFEGFGSPRGRF